MFDSSMSSCLNCRLKTADLLTRQSGLLLKVIHESLAFTLQLLKLSLTAIFILLVKANQFRLATNMLRLFIVSSPNARRESHLGRGLLRYIVIDVGESKNNIMGTSNVDIG